MLKASLPILLPSLYVLLSFVDDLGLKAVFYWVAQDLKKYFSLASNSLSFSISLLGVGNTGVLHHT